MKMKSTRSYCSLILVDLPDLWPSDILILAFVVFNPGDLYYLGYKKIIIIIITRNRKQNRAVAKQQYVQYVFSLYFCVKYAVLWGREFSSEASCVDNECFGPDLQNVLRLSYDYLTIMSKLRSTYDGCLISYKERKAFLKYDSLAKS